ncbi:MAG: bifunctional methylenetetrahydrofolate dehydrogenase/methenyltetrahydrofolate cyclohydrolase FolD [Clostridiales bacterium]|jgi:methylenetetrahydrofolate dehydrogenase (NADP+)/methenyltetrahydrofolate cyclohydrolase|nr:bifunctional methylenetetrahydrofolate dehydrogenase/methenyltetrahydrofolate cyclohydrolase FolD [Clostridiales bacterium]
MPAQIIDGKALSDKLRVQIASRAAALKRRGKETTLAVIMAGDNPASEVYVRNKIKACGELGIRSLSYRFPETVPEVELIDLIAKLNLDPAVDGILVQLPLPRRLDEQTLLSLIRPEKDADGFHSVNAGNLFLGRPAVPACTPAGIIELIKSTGAPIEGRHAVVAGRSNIVGKPVSVLLLNENATVTICHSKTPDLKEHTRRADILVAAIGRGRFITGDMVKPGATVIDVGMNREGGKLCGDVDFESASRVAGYITPVPGGVGPMTITMLLSNTVAIAERADGI